MSKEPIPIQKLIDAEIDYLSGKSMAAIKRDHNIAPKRLESSLAKIDTVIDSDAPALTFERKLISDVMTERLKPIKEKLAFESLDIVTKADQILKDRLNENPGLIKTKELVAISDVHSKRLSRLTGIDEVPEDDPSKAGGERVKTVNIFVQNIFKDHKKRLDDQRETVNSNDLTPIFDADVKNKEVEVNP